MNRSSLKLTNSSKKYAGFTIIEVLIVLAIAGLIMVVVFLAVPGLQRSQRNTQQRTEANNLLAAAQEIQGNKGGVALVSGDAANVKSAANTKNITTVTIAGWVTGTNSDPAVLTTAAILTGAKCAAADSGTTAQGVNSRQMAIVFDVETSGGGTQVQCVNS